MDIPNNDDRKRRSATVRDNIKKRKQSNLQSNRGSTNSSPQPKKLIDQLFETWKNNVDSSSQCNSSQEEKKTEISKKFNSAEAAVKLQKSSLQLKLSELKVKESKLDEFKSKSDRDEKFLLGILNSALESANDVYEEIKNMSQSETSYDQKLNETDEIRSLVKYKLEKEMEKLDDYPTEVESLNKEIEKESAERQDSMEYSVKLQEEKKRIQELNQTYSLVDMEKKLEEMKQVFFNLMEEKIALENSLQEEIHQNIQDDLKHNQEQQELDAQLEKFQKESEDFNNVDDTLEVLNEKVKETLFKNLNPEDITDIDLTEKLQEIKKRIEELEFKIDAKNQRTKLTDSFCTLDNKLNEAKEATDLVSMQNNVLKNLDELLDDKNNELNRLLEEEVTKEIDLRNKESEELNLQLESINKEIMESLRELNDCSNFDEEEALIHTLKLELSQKQKIHNEVMDNYTKFKEINTKQLGDHPNLLDSKASKSFDELKIKLRSDFNLAEKKEISLDKANELKLKELEHKAEKYQHYLGEMEEELSSNSKKYTDLEKQIEDAEEILEGKINAKNEREIKRETELKKELERKKEIELRKEAEKKKELELQKELERKRKLELKKEAEKKKEMELQKEKERIKEIELKKEEKRREMELKKEMEAGKKKEIKKETEYKRKNLPVITQNEAVKLDEETLSLIKTLKEKLPPKPINSEVSQITNSANNNLSQKSPGSLKSVSPLKTSTENLPAFQSSQSSQKLFESVFSQFSQKSNRSQKTDKSPKTNKSPKKDVLSEINSQSFPQEENFTSLTQPNKQIKDEPKEPPKSSERIFFKTQRRSKSLTPRKM